jgi:hypothetical protein
VQPFPSPPGPERRGRFTAIAFLLAGFLVTSTIAVVQYVQLRTANERIEELEAARDPDGGNPDAEGDGGLFGDFDDLFDDLFEDVVGDVGDLFEGSGDLGSLVECLGSPFSGSGEAGATVGAIAEQVESIRELAFTAGVEPTFLSDEEMTGRVRELFLEDYTPEIADLEERLLTALGAIPPGTDLRQLRADTIGPQVAGFYDTETKELVVRQAGEELSVIDRITLAHELTHALTDQALGIPLPDRVELGREDEDLAALAVVEGDATLVMQQYSATLGFDEQFELLDPEAIAASEAGLAAAPPYLEQELLFAYEAGLSFVCGLYAEGGWDAVNAAYEEPPTSTAQILFPERYTPGAERVDPKDPGPLRPPWRRTAKLQLGAANLLWLFEAPGGDRTEALDDPLGAAGAWTGGELELWERREQSALGISLLQESGSDRLCNAVRDWYGASFDDDRPTTVPATIEMSLEGDRQDAILDCDGDRVRLGIAPDLGTALRLTA